MAQSRAVSALENDGSVERRSPRALQAIAGGGLVAGVLDISDAFIFWGLRGVAPSRILHSIASGLLGTRAYEGGAATAALGGVLHFFIATVVAAVYVVASLKLPVLIRRPILCGLSYGVVVFFVMQYVVLPISAFRGGPLPLSVFINGVLIHALGVGLPIALIARWSARAR